MTNNLIQELNFQLYFRNRIVSGEVSVREASLKERRDCISEEAERILSEHGIIVKGLILQDPVGTATFFQEVIPSEEWGFPFACMIPTKDVLPERCCILQFEGDSTLFPVYFIENMWLPCIGFIDRLGLASERLPLIFPLGGEKPRHMAESAIELRRAYPVEKHLQQELQKLS